MGVFIHPTFLSFPVGSFCQLAIQPTTTRHSMAKLALVGGEIFEVGARKIPAMTCGLDKKTQQKQKQKDKNKNVGFRVWGGGEKRGGPCVGMCQ